MLPARKSIMIYDSILLTYYHNRLCYFRGIGHEQSRSNQSQIIGRGSTDFFEERSPLVVKTNNTSSDLSNMDVCITCTMSVMAEYIIRNVRCSLVSFQVARYRWFQCVKYHIS